MIYIHSMKDSDAANIMDAIATASGSFDYSSLIGSATPMNTMDAINTFVIRMKNYGLWDKTLALYGDVGGNANSHAINWKNPGTNNITWGGTLTHALTGVTSDGSTGYGNPGILTTAVGTNSAGWLAVYSRTISANSNIREIGSDSGPSNYYGITLQIGVSTYPTGRACNIGGERTENSAKYTGDDSSGFFLGSRTSTTLITLYRNGVSKATYTSTVAAPTGKTLYLHGANANGSLQSVSNRQLCLKILGNVSGGGLDATEAANLNTIVQELQTRLGRNV